MDKTIELFPARGGQEWHAYQGDRLLGTGKTKSEARNSGILELKMRYAESLMERNEVASWKEACKKADEDWGS